MRSMPRLPPTPRHAAAALLVCAVLLGHAALLYNLWPEAPMPRAVVAPPVASMRLVAPALPLPPPQAAPLRAMTPAQAALQAPPRALPAAPAAPSAPAALRAEAPVLLPAASSEGAAGQDLAPAPPVPADDAPVPVYATRLPDPALLHYRLQRGDVVGSGSLHWHSADGAYALRLHTAWPGRPATGLASRGLLDADGMAPLRHADLKREREQRAVNFEREAGRITFSGPQARYALRPGAQDRLSWMIQLPAIVQADAALARDGAGITLFVAGTRGDAEPWRFEVLGREALALPAGEVAQALLLRREPTRPYDTRVEVWLDPQRQHLPVRARFTTLPGGSVLELLLAEAP
jgi:hypothetical protein